MPSALTERRVLYATLHETRTVVVLVVDEREAGYRRMARTAERRLASAD